MHRCTFGTSCSLCDYIRTPLPISIAEFGFTWQSRLFREASCRNSRGWSFRSFASERETIAWSDVIKIRFEYPWKGVCMWEGGRERERERERWVGGGDEMTSRTFSFKSFNRPAYYRLSSFSLVYPFYWFLSAASYFRLRKHRYLFLSHRFSAGIRSANWLSFRGTNFPVIYQIDYFHRELLINSISRIFIRVLFIKNRMAIRREITAIV